MILIERVKMYGLYEAIHGMRNPKNSWSNSDSEPGYEVGPEDLGLMLKLAKAGPVHAKYRRFIVVYLNITAPLYWWKEFDTYRAGVVDNPMDIEMNSCSTMHKIHTKPFTMDDFSHEHLDDLSLELLGTIIQKLNANRHEFVNWQENDTSAMPQQHYWWQMIQLLPQSYNQKRTIMLNYEVLANIIENRDFHKLDEWHILCKWAKTLPYSEIITANGSREK